MIRRVLAASIALLIVTELVAAREGMVVKTNWSGFRGQVTQRKLENRSVWISLPSGDEIKCRLTRVGENGIVVRSNRATKHWTSGKGEATVPRDAISSVRFGGKVGKGGLIGGLVGLGAGAAVTGAVAAGMGGGACEGPSCGAVMVLIPLAAVGGWLVGRATAKSAPVFVIQP